MALMAEADLLSATGVYAERDGMTILHNINFSLRPGEIHAVVGEHHSGKSALGGLFTGETAWHAGEVRIRGAAITSLSQKEAAKQGISRLYQKSKLISGLNVFENIFLGRLPGFLFNKDKLIAKASQLLDRVGADVSPFDKMDWLDQPNRNLVELAGLLSNNPNIIILDEVSRRYNPEEMENVLTIINDVRQQGGGIVFISTSIDEIVEFADRVTILRDGACRGTEKVQSADRVELQNRTYSYVVSRESLRKSNIELHNYKKYNEQILRNLPIGIVILDPNHRIHLVNETARTILSAGGVQHEFKVAGDLPAPVRSLLAAQELMDELVKFTYQDMVVQATAFPFDDADNVILGLILLLEDVTQETRMKEHLIRAERVKSTAALAASLAHEINNPLCIMKNYLELTLRQVDNAGTRENLGKVGTELNHIVRIVNDLLPFSRQQESLPHPLDLRLVTGDTVRLMQMNCADSNVQISFADCPDSLWINGDENRLKQVIVNLVVNGQEAGLNGKDVIINVSLTRNEDTAHLVVADNGPGIPDDLVKQIFDPFFSSKQSKTNTGLGLSICQHIIQSYNGIIHYQRRGEWSEFVVEFPLIPE